MELIAILEASAQGYHPAPVPPENQRTPPRCLEEASIPGRDTSHDREAATVSPLHPPATDDLKIALT